MTTRMHQAGQVLDYTNPSSSDAVSAGTLVKIAGLVGVVINDIPASGVGAVQVEGVVAIPKKQEAIEAGLPIRFDANGDPYNGTAGTGAATADASSAMAAADLLCGSAAYAAAATDEEVYVRLNAFSPDYPAWANRVHIKKTADYTVLGTDNGKVIHVNGSAELDDIVILTMTAVATLGDGFEVIIVNDAADGQSQCQIELHNDDKFLNPAVLDDGDQLHNTLATSKRGDYKHLRSSAAGFYVEDGRGTWADGGA